MTLKNVQYPYSCCDAAVAAEHRVPMEHLIPAEHILLCRYLIIHYCTIPIISILYILYNNDFKKTCDISNKDIILLYNKST